MGRDVMPYLIQIFIFFWLLISIKSVLFWIYLWQLKEYHIGRFLDHFTTHKGKKLIFGFSPIFKLVLLVLLFFSNHFVFLLLFYILLITYAGESFHFVIGLLKRNAKKPVFTLKTLLLTTFSLLLLVFYLVIVVNFTTFGVVLSILLFDILSPKIISAIVLMVQPFFVFARNGVLEKATGKIKKFKNLKVVAITGSYGKTSTKEFLTTILSLKFNVLSTPEHKNSEIGIAQTILGQLHGDHEVFVVEMGSYNRGGIKLLCNMVKPKIGIVTGVNEQHLSTFGSMENLLSAEGGGELMANLPHNNGLLVVNGDNKYCVDLYKKANIDKKIYSVLGDKVSSDIWAEEISINKDSLDFMAITQHKEAAHFKVNVLGQQNIQNLLGAILVAKELGMDLEEIVVAAKNIRREQAGITLKNGVHGINVIDSSYSSNPNGVMADLDYLNVFPNKKIIIMPCLIELGGKSAEIHRQIGEKIAQICDMAIITTRERFKDIKNGATTNGMAANHITFSENPKEIFNLITTFCKKEDAVLLEGRVPCQLIKLLVSR